MEETFDIVLICIYRVNRRKLSKIPLTLFPVLSRLEYLNKSQEVFTFYTRGGRGGDTLRVQGFTREVTGKETGGNELAPPVANCCGGRGNILRRTCKCLAAAAKRLKPLGFWRWLDKCSDCHSRCKDTKKIAELQEKSVIFNQQPVIKIRYFSWKVCRCRFFFVPLHTN